MVGSPLESVIIGPEGWLILPVCHDTEEETFLTPRKKIDNHFFVVRPFLHFICEILLIEHHMGSISICSVHKLTSRDEKFLAEPGFEPGASGLEAQMLPLCYASPLRLTIDIHDLTSKS